AGLRLRRSATTSEEIEMTERIYVSMSDLPQLRSLIDAHWTGRDGEAAQRLSGELDRAILVDVHQMPSDVVRIESRVTFEETQTGAVREVVLVYPSKADASAGRVSVLAPIGAALLGLRVGDRIEWPLPDGSTARIRILTVAQGVGE